MELHYGGTAWILSDELGQPSGYVCLARPGRRVEDDLALIMEEIGNFRQPFLL
jgi:hypothetical protein